MVPVALAAGFAWLAYVTGGGGALLFLAVSGTTLWWWRVHRDRTSSLWPVAAGFMFALLLWNGVSLAKYAIPDRNDQLSARVAEWGRDHGMGPVIDRIETAVYAKPPSVQPARTLDLAATTTTSSTDNTNRTPEGIAATAQTTLPRHAPAAVPAGSVLDH